MRREKTNRQIVDVPRAHYADLYAKSDAREIAARTGLDYDERAGCFSLKLVGTAYRIGFPVFDAVDENGKGLSPYEEILLLRYLLEGKYVPRTDLTLSYAEMPWGSVYINQFKSRVIGRIAREFGRNPALLTAAVERTRGLSFEKVGAADAAYRFEVLNGLFMDILVWAGDEEFPASAQALFSDNFKYAFTAEDMAVCGDIVISRLKQGLK